MKVHDVLVGAIWREDKSRKEKNCRSHRGGVLLWQQTR